MTAEMMMEMVHDMTKEVIKHYGDDRIEMCDITQVISLYIGLEDEDLVETFQDEIIELLSDDYDVCQVIYENGKRVEIV